MTIDADVVLASSSGWAHGIPAPAEARLLLHAGRGGCTSSVATSATTRRAAPRSALKVLGPWLRRWDLRAAHTASDYVTISSVVQDRVHSGLRPRRRRCCPPHGRTPTPARPSRCREVEQWLDGEEFELCVSRLLPYKNVDQVVAAYAHEPRRKLIVVGRGPQKPALQAAAGDNVLFLEGITDGQLAWLYRRTRH